MITITELLYRIGASQDCRLLPPTTLPEVDSHILPDDLRQFYTFTGGASLFSDSDYFSRILSPQEVIPANPLIASDLGKADISDDWYVIATDDNGDYLCIDLNPVRLGRCYDCFHETYGLIGQVPIIAHSFTELLTSLLDNCGDYPYWLKADFLSHGDAYDQIFGR